MLSVNRNVKFQNLWFTQIKVKDVISPDFKTVTVNTKISELQDSLLINTVLEEVLVIDLNERLCGLITRKQFVKEFAEGKIKPYMTVEEVMINAPIITSPEEDLNRAREAMRKAKIGRLPVTDENDRVIGVLTAMQICNGYSDRVENIGRQLHAILDTIREAVFVIDREGRVIYWNHGAERIYEIRKEEIVGELISTFIPNNFSLQVLESGQPINNIYIIDKGKHILINALPLYEGDNLTGVVYTAQDVTKFVNLLSNLNQARDRISDLERSGTTDYDKLLLAPFLSPAFSRTIQTAKRLAETDATVLIQGESGTGKEILANAIHRCSERKDKPFVVINCAAIPETLFESELFGYANGAFTGASKGGRPGKFELASEGTLFLDEIGELPMDMQAKLLRVLQEKSYYRIGGIKPIITNTRIVAATNKDLRKMVQTGKFREDLFYRLNVFGLKVPPLRQRREDISCLVEYFLDEFSDKYSKSVPEITEGAMSILVNYDWPGNVRELRNTIERLVVFCEYKKVNPEDITILINDSDLGESSIPIPVKDVKSNHLNLELEQREREVIISLLRKCKYNKSEVARILNIPRSTLYYRMKSLNIACSYD